MTRSHRSLFSLIPGVVLLSVFAVCVHAQENTGKPNAEEIAALREKAFKLLDAVAGQLTTLQSAENRARMGANIVDSLWKHDEERARSLLRVVQEDIKTELQKPDDDPSDRTFKVFLKLRYDTVERIAKHDGQTALDFLRVTCPVFDKNEPYDFSNNEQTIELRLAKQIAANNPEAALKLAREALAQGLHRDLLSLLAKLNRKHKDQAQVLYKEMVEKLRDADFVGDWSSAQFAQMLIQGFEPPDADVASYRELVGRVVKTALAEGCGKKQSDESEMPGFCQWSANAVVAAERYEPSVARIKQWANGSFDSQRSLFAHEEVQELLQEGAFDEVEALASKYPEMQVGIYQRAVFHAIAVGDMDQARKIIDRFPGDPQVRQNLLAQIERIDKKQAVTDEQLAEIRKRAEAIPSAQLRAQYFVSVASQIAASDKKLAMKFLEHAGETIDALKPGKEQTQTRVTLALQYSVLKSDRGFTIMESLLPKLNELVEIAVKLDGYDTNYIRDGEWNMSANGSVGEILTIMSQQAGDFAWCDFDRAVNLASQFERPEIRMMALLKLAQSILAGPRRPPLRRWVSYDFR